VSIFAAVNITNASKFNKYNLVVALTIIQLWVDIAAFIYQKTENIKKKPVVLTMGFFY